jgi:type IV pilus assembly protein PilW
MHESLSILSRRARPVSSRRQAGLTLIEFMVSIVIGMLMIAAIATLIANQSSTRGEIDKSGRMIENGRYATQVLAADLQMAGYWGESEVAPGTATAMPNACDVTVANLLPATGLHVQGYNFDAGTTATAPLSGCVTNHQPGTDVLVVRRLDPDSSATETAGATDLSKVAENQVYVQTGLASGAAQLSAVLAAGSADAGVNTAAFTLKKRNGTLSALRKLVVHVYYISKCSVEIAGSCTGADGGTPIPTLKRLELGAGPGFTKVTIAEGIEKLQVDYGVDGVDADGAPNGADVSGAALDQTTWPDVMTVKVHLLARSSEVSGGFTDTKTYALGTFGTASAAAGERGYKRHMFVQSVRLVNPSGRRVL